MVTQLPLFQSSSSWTPPTSFPDLSGADYIGIDLETCDPNLKTNGPGAIRGDGFIAGVAVHTGFFTGYFPVRHEGGGNLDEKCVFAWLSSQLKGNQPKIGANLLYDLKWLQSYGIASNGPAHDVQFAEALLDEESLEGYSLEVLAKKYLGVGKDEILLRQAATEWGVDPKGGLWKLPARYVGSYAEADARLACEVLIKQRPLLEADELLPVFDIETRLIKVLLAMYKLGVRVDLDKAEKLSKEMFKKEQILGRKLDELAGFHVNPWSGADISKFVNKVNGYPSKAIICPPTTKTGAHSFTKDWIKVQGHPFMKTLNELRSINKMRRDFIDEMVLGCNVKGRIHTDFHPLRRDEEGTRSGRFSSTNPNLQQVPARDEVWAPLIRGLFIPEDGCEWGKLDYSQQEPRLLLHYAVTRKLSGSEEVLRRYKKDPRTDWYTLITEAAGISRREAKDCTLGRFYGMGIKKFAYKLNIPQEDAAEILAKFDREFPFVQELSQSCTSLAARRGYIRTILGRRRRFNLWEPTFMEENERYGAMPLDKAQLRWPGKNFRRAFTHKALNSLIQGSAGDMTKMAMVELYEQHGKVPHLTVHDELDASMTSREEALVYKVVMEGCITKMLTPVLADLHLGPSWGAAKKLSL